eukprot:TRINITY_DN9661_c0_g1_i1.p1 TRINITY_DN9661_c0_g1~~TRINITY_DN9661_c0_g1_i1.p1  ORF type:complete len:779 (+),score=119.73 TRINITY_DN9661_c0_g1_i1:45-2339(+)
MDGGLVMIVVICSLMPVVFIALYCLMWKCRSQNEWNEDDMKATSCSDSKEGDGRRPPEDDEEECRRFGVGWTNDFDFLVFHLHTISHRESLRYSLGVYLVFLSIFTYTLVAHSGLGNGSSFWATDAVIHRLESRWKSISREKMFWDFMTTGVDLESGGGGLLQLYNLSQQTVASYNHILPIIRVGQHRVKPVKCDNLDDLLQGNYHGWSTKCYPEYSRSNEDRITFGNATCKDRLNKNGFAWSDLSKVRFPGEEFLPWATLGGYVSDYPSQLGYFVDTYSESSSRDVLQFFNCLFKGGWIDEATREVHVKFFTFNANLGIFLRVILMIEINPAGVWRTRVESLVFEEIDVWRIVMEAVVLAFVVFYIVMLFREIIAYILRTKSLILWVFSVWRVIEIANLAIFLVVFYYKVNYWAFPHHELRLGEDTPDEIKNHPNAKDPNWYDSLVFMRLDNTMANLKVVSNLSAFNGVLVYLKLIKFFRTSPRLMILSETIKDALSSLIAILVYLLLVTQAYAMMGVSIWGTKLKDMRTLPEAWTYLLLSLLGDFDFNELADLEPFYAYLFFVTYQVLVWLVILNIVIGIVTSSYEKARAWQKRISGDTPVGPYMRNWIAQTETLIKDRLGFKRAKNIYIRKVTLYLRTRHRRASRKVDGYLGDDAMPILDDHTSTTVSRNVFAEQETRISDLIRNLAERSDHHITQEKPVFLLHITVCNSLEPNATVGRHRPPNELHKQSLAHIHNWCGRPFDIPTENKRDLPKSNQQWLA